MSVHCAHCLEGVCGSCDSCDTACCEEHSYCCVVGGEFLCPDCVKWIGKDTYCKECADEVSAEAAKAAEGPNCQSCGSATRKEDAYYCVLRGELLCPGCVYWMDEESYCKECATSEVEIYLAAAEAQSIASAAVALANE